VISITLLIVLVAKSRFKTVGIAMTFRQILKQEFTTLKELYIMPSVIILSAIPQTILSFSLACTQLSYVKRHVLLTTLLLSYTPQVLGFMLYVLPSTAYKKEFEETAMGKWCFKWIFKANNKASSK
jgi:hypothetical protein